MSAQADILPLLIKMPAMVTDFRGHRRTLYYLPGIIIGIIMVALWKKKPQDENIMFYIFILWFLLLSFFSSPNLSGRKLDAYHTSTHGVAPV